MNYKDLLHTGKSCPFCPRQLDDQNCHQVIYETKQASLLINRAPYTKDHLLVAPLRHVTDIESLSQTESKEITRLIQKALLLLKKRGHKAYSILIRQGKASGKSIQHTHVHIIPDVVVTEKEHASLERPVISAKKMSTLVQMYKNILEI